MRLALQLLYHLQRSVFVETNSKCLNQQLRYRHRGTKLDMVKTNKSKCLDPKPPKKSFWNIFKSKAGAKCIKEAPKDTDCTKVPKPVPKHQIDCDLANIARQTGGQVYKTCGPAYLVQKDYIDQPEIEPQKEETILEDMLKDPSLKGQCDPMPDFETVEKRLLEMSERRLHPLYRVMMTIPKRPASLSKIFKPAAKPYKMRSGPILPDEIPAHLKINKDMFGKKNIMCDFKKAQPPQQMLSRLAEIKKNERPTMEQNIETRKRTNGGSK